MTAQAQPPASAHATDASSKDSRQPLVHIDNVSIQRGPVTVLRNLCFTLYTGDHTAVTGANGSGKSTLLRCIQGELQPTLESQHAITWHFGDDTDTSRITALTHIRLVSPDQQQQYVWHGWKITGEELILSGLTNAKLLYGTATNAEKAQAQALAEAVQASHLLHRTLPELSQGQLRLLLILRALISSPTLLLLDEPFEGLDASARQQIEQLLAYITASGCTLMITAHRQADIPTCINHIYELKENTLVRLSPFTSHIDPQSSRLHVDTHLPWRTRAEMPRCDTGCPTTSPTLSLTNIDVYIERKQVLFTINWDIMPHEQWILAGTNGSGKSTLLRLLYGEECAAYGGMLHWKGHLRPDLETWHRHVGYVSDRLQDTYRYNLSALEIVISGIRGTVGLYCDTSTDEQAHAAQWLEAMQLGTHARTPFRSLSTGLARRVLLARALAAEPHLLLLDEPCSGLDPDSRMMFHHTLQLAMQHGIQCVYVSHHETNLPAPFSHMLVLADGHIIYKGLKEHAPAPYRHEQGRL